MAPLGSLWRFLDAHFDSFSSLFKTFACFSSAFRPPWMFLGASGRHNCVNVGPSALFFGNLGPHFLALVEGPCAFEPMKTNVFRTSTKVVYLNFFRTKSPLVLQCKQPTLKINSLTIHWDGQFTHSQFTETPASAFCAAFRHRSGTAAAILVAKGIILAYVRPFVRPFRSL